MLGLLLSARPSPLALRATRPSTLALRALREQGLFPVIIHMLGLRKRALPSSDFRRASSTRCGRLQPRLPVVVLWEAGWWSRRCGRQAGVYRRSYTRPALPSTHIDWTYTRVYPGRRQAGEVPWCMPSCLTLSCVCCYLVVC